MSSYYKTIDGVKYDRGLLEAADAAVADGGEISQGDAEKLLNEVKDGNSYTDVEKATVKYIRNNYTWAEDADAWFRKEINVWNLTGHKNK